MIFALLLLAAIPDWVPAHWSSNQPRSLDLLNGTGVNCILVDSAKLNKPFVDASNAHGLAAVAVIHPGLHASEQAQASIRLGLSALALEGDFDPRIERELRSVAGPLPVISLASRQAIRLDSRDPILGTNQGLWPGIVIEHGGTVMAGPSSNPWVNTNTGFLRFLRASTQSALWLGVSPPAHTVVPVERYGIAIADAAAAGARWIITLDDDLNQRLLTGDVQALRDWRRICAYVQYFEQRREWRAYTPFSRMALMQDADSGGLLSAGLLDLMYAQHIAALPVPVRRLNEASLAGVRTVINLEPPAEFSPLQKQTLAHFAQTGGVLLNPPADWKLGSDAPNSISPTRKQLDRIQDIWEMLYNATARKNFGARTFNTAGILFNVLSSPDQKRLLLHLVNYTGFPADSITVHVLGTWAKAHLFTPGQPVQELGVYPVKDGTAIEVDKLDVTAALVVE